MSTFFTRLRKGLQRGEQEVRIVLHFSSRNPEIDQTLYAIARESEQVFRNYVENALFNERELVALKRIDIVRGSVEFWVTLATAYTLISQYGDFEQSMRRIIERIISAILAAFSQLGIHELMVQPPTVPHEDVIKSQRTSQDRLILILVSYLIVSHAVLLAIIIRIVLKMHLP